MVIVAFAFFGAAFLALGLALAAAFLVAAGFASLFLVVGFATVVDTLGEVLNAWFRPTGFLRTTLKQGLST